MLNRFARLALVLIALCAVPAVASAATGESVRLPFADLGYIDDVTIKGPSPRFTLYVPVYSQLRSARLHVPLHVSPLVDRRSSITVSVNRTPIYTASIAQIGTNPTLDLPIRLPNVAQNALEITISGHLLLTGDLCTDLQGDDLYMIVANGGEFVVNLAPLPAKPYITDLLHDYRGRVRVVVPNGVNAETSLAAAQLPYFLHQLIGWRRLSVTYGTDRENGAHNIVVGDFARDLEVRGLDLYVNRNGMALIRKQLDRALLTDAVSNSKVDDPLANRRTQISLDDLGVATQTASGIGDLPFSIPLSFAQLGGSPDDVHAHIVITHTPLATEDRGSLSLMVNGTLVHSFELRKAGGEEEFDATIGAQVLRAANDVRIVPSYFFRRDGCRGAYPQMTVSLLNESFFSWGNFVRQNPSVGDFFRQASGRVVVLVDRGMERSAFPLLDTLGALNSSIKTLDVKAFDGTVPTDYDYAVVIAPPDRLTSIPVELRPTGQRFEISDRDAKRVLYAADYSEPFGTLQTTLSGATPVLVATYWKDKNVFSALDHLQANEVAAQTDTIFLFNRERGTYSSLDPSKRRTRAQNDNLRTAPIPLILGFVLILALLVVLAARRRNQPPKQ